MIALVGAERVAMTALTAQCPHVFTLKQRLPWMLCGFVGDDSVHLRLLGRTDNGGRCLLLDQWLERDGVYTMARSLRIPARVGIVLDTAPDRSMLDGCACFIDWRFCASQLRDGEPRENITYTRPQRATD